jgi:hypothetical protein
MAPTRLRHLGVRTMVAHELGGLPGRLSPALVPSRRLTRFVAHDLNDPRMALFGHPRDRTSILLKQCC